MQILTLSDEIKHEVYCGNAKARFPHVQLILSCGDLRPYYLEFVVSALNVPCLYVPGNHDAHPEIREDGEIVVQPAGCENIDGRLVHRLGLAIAGLGGSPWYNGEPYQYTEGEMLLRVLLLAPRLLLWQRRTGRRLDIMIAHAAPRGVQDGTGPHRGFAAFRWLIERFQPRYFIHGHVHPAYGFSKTTETVLGRTTVINTVGFRVLEIAPVEAETYHQAGA